MKRIFTFAALAGALLAVPAFGQAVDPAQPRLQPRPSIDQPGDPANELNRAADREAQPGERVQAQKPQVQDTQNQAFAQHAAACLILANEGEIAVTKAAMDNLQSDEARQLAQQIVKDHTQYVSKLKQHAPQAANLKLDVKAHASSDRATTGRVNAASSAATEASSPTDPAHGSATAAQRSAGESMADKALRVKKAATENCVQMTVEKMQKDIGDSFDQAFLGWAIGTHVTMLSELKALENEVQDQQFTSLLQKGQETTKSHMQKAEQLMRQNTDGQSNENASSTNRRERDAAPRRTDSETVPATPRPNR